MSLRAFLSLLVLFAASGCGNLPLLKRDAPASDASLGEDAAVDADIADAYDAHIPCDGGPATFNCAPIAAEAAGPSCRGIDLPYGDLPVEYNDASFAVGCSSQSHPSGYHDDPAIWGDGCSGMSCDCERVIVESEAGPPNGPPKEGVAIGQWSCPL